MNNFAKIEDVEKLWRSLTEDEKERAKNLLPIVEDSLRMEADKVGKNLDRMIEEKEIRYARYGSAASRDDVDRSPMTQN